MKYLILCLFLISCTTHNWKEASRESAGLVPSAEETTETTFYIFYARAFSWRGYFGVHPWMAWKRKGDKEFTVAQVTFWKLRYSESAVSLAKDLPDRKWYGNTPYKLFEAKGDKALTIIGKVEKLLPKYPYESYYKVWPGPNSNTFVAYFLREIPELNIELPPHAVGKDFLGHDKFFALTPSQTGFQFNAFGLLGFELGLAEGIEFNILGINFGIDLYTPALKLPGFGRIGFRDQGL